MRKEIIADFDEVWKHLKEGWTVDIGGDPVTLNLANGNYLDFRNLTPYKCGTWAFLADRTAVCTKPDEPVIGHAHFHALSQGKDWVWVNVPKGQGEQFRHKTVEIRVVDNSPSSPLTVGGGL